MKAVSADTKVQQEINQFRGVEVVHALPPAYHFWSSRFVRPKFVALGYKGLQDFNISTVQEVAARLRPGEVLNLVSIGSGNCDIEIELATKIKAVGIERFHFKCVDLNQSMLDRGSVAAERKHLANHFAFVQSDLGDLKLEEGSTHIAFANQSLHHIVDLENLFQSLLQSLDDRGTFLICDMIGRNGHMMWPEALEYVELLWRSLDRTKKFHHVLRTHHDDFPNTDFSSIGFEGVRAQDILPLLTQYFAADVFIGAGNITRPFIGRGYGANYDVENPADMAFINFVGALDENLIDRGVIKPTLMFGSFVKRRTRPQRFFRHWSAEYCIRWPDPTPTSSTPPIDS